MCGRNRVAMFAMDDPNHVYICRDLVAMLVAVGPSHVYVRCLALCACVHNITQTHACMRIYIYTQITSNFEPFWKKAFGIQGRDSAGNPTSMHDSRAMIRRGVLLLFVLSKQGIFR